MRKQSLLVSLLGAAFLAASQATPADMPRSGGMMPEVVGSLEEWNPAAGYLVVGGVRYTIAPGVAVTSPFGETLKPGELERGAQVGILEIKGQVQRIVLFR